MTVVIFGHLNRSLYLLTYLLIVVIVLTVLTNNSGLQIKSLYKTLKVRVEISMTGDSFSKVRLVCYLVRFLTDFLDWASLSVSWFLCMFLMYFLLQFF